MTEREQRLKDLIDGFDRNINGDNTYFFVLVSLHQYAIDENLSELRKYIEELTDKNKSNDSKRKGVHSI